MRKGISLLVTAAVLACGNPVEPGPPEPDPGFVTVSITSAPQGVGAIRFTLTGNGAVIDSVRSSGLTLFGASASATVHRGIVVGSIGGGEVLRFWMPDRNAMANYQAVLDEAAAAGTYTQLAVSAIAVTIESVGS